MCKRQYRGRRRSCPPGARRCSSVHRALERRKPACHGSGRTPTGRERRRPGRARGGGRERRHAWPATSSAATASSAATTARLASGCRSSTRSSTAWSAPSSGAVATVTSTFLAEHAEVLAEQPQRAQLVDRLDPERAALLGRGLAHLGDDRRLLVGQLGRGTQLHPSRPPAHHPPRVAERDAGQLEHHPVGRHLGPAAARGLRLGDRGRNVNIRQQPRRRSALAVAAL